MPSIVQGTDWMCNSTSQTQSLSSLSLHSSSGGEKGFKQTKQLQVLGSKQKEEPTLGREIKKDISEQVNLS